MKVIAQNTTDTIVKKKIVEYQLFTPKNIAILIKEPCVLLIVREVAQ
jgi:hypothetical protein